MTQTLPTTSDSNIGPLYWVAGSNEKTKSHIFKAAVYNSTKGEDVPVSLSFEGVEAGFVKLEPKSQIMATSNEEILALAAGGVKYHIL